MSLMRKLILAVAALFASISLSASGQPANWLEAYRAPAAKLIAASQGSDFAWQRLAEVTDLYGHRLSG